MTVRGDRPSGVIETAPLTTLNPVDIAEAAAAESVTYAPCGEVTSNPIAPWRNTTSVVANGCRRSTALEYRPKSHWAGAAPSATMTMMFFGDCAPAGEAPAMICAATSHKSPAAVASARVHPRSPMLVLLDPAGRPPVPANDKRGEVGVRYGARRRSGRRS